MNRIEEQLPLGAATRYDVSKGTSAFYITEDGVIGEVHGGEAGSVTVPLFVPKPGTAKRLEAALVAQKGPFTGLRVIYADGGQLGIVGFR